VRQDAPRVSGYPILMRAGDLLIQPPRTVHAPMSRWFGWNSKTMLRTAESALLDLRYDGSLDAGRANVDYKDDVQGQAHD
jgi:hypothetical protein